MSVALHGNLRDFGMGEVFQLIGQQRKSGVLEVRGSGGQVELWFDLGRIVVAAPAGAHDHAALGEMLVRCGLLTRERLAELENEREVSLCSLPQLLVDRAILSAQQIADVEDLLTRDTIFDLLRWSEGSFRFEAREVRHARAADSLLGAEQVLMDGLRMVDEWRTFAGDVPSESIVFRPVGSFADYRRARTGRESERLADQERVFLLIDGRASARRVIDLARLGTFEGTRVLAELRRVRLIEPTAPPRGDRPLRPSSGSRAREWRRTLAAVLGLAALAGTALVSHGRVRADALATGLEIRAPSLDDARLRFESRLARNLLEAYRFEHGQPPPTLGELLRWSGSHAGALAHPRRAPYYYARGEQDMILLAPEH